MSQRGSRPWPLSRRRTKRTAACAWRIPNCRCQCAPPRGLIFSSTLLTLSGHEKYVHGFHLPCGPNPQTPQAWWHEGIDCRESAAEATAGSSHPSRKRAPNLSPLDHFLLDLWTIFLDPRRIKRAALLVKPTTLLRCHQALIKWKYRLLYSSQKRGKPGPKGPSRQLMDSCWK